MSYASRKYIVTRHDPIVVDDGHEEAAPRPTAASPQQPPFAPAAAPRKTQLRYTSGIPLPELAAMELEDHQHHHHHQQRQSPGGAAPSPLAHASSPLPPPAPPAPPPPPPPPPSGPLIVIDGANVAWHHGKHHRASLTGILLALRWFAAASCDALAFVPSATAAAITAKAGDGAAGGAEEEARAALAEMLLAGTVVPTPAADEDDLYVLSYARTRGGCVVSNDQYRDHIEAAFQDSEEEGRALSQWVADSRISFTFVRNDEFLPNPAHPLIKALQRQHTAAAAAADHHAAAGGGAFGGGWAGGAAAAGVRAAALRALVDGAGAREEAAGDWLAAAAAASAALATLAHADASGGEGGWDAADAARARAVLLWRRAAACDHLGLPALALRDAAAMVEATHGSAPECVAARAYAMEAYLASVNGGGGGGAGGGGAHGEERFAADVAREDALLWSEAARRGLAPPPR